MCPRACQLITWGDRRNISAHLDVVFPMSRARLLLLAGVAVPIIYFSTVLATSSALPGYSHLTQYASEPGLFGVGLLFGAFFPMPDPRHGGYGLGMGIHLAPVFLVLALRRVDRRRGLVRYLIVTAVLMLALLRPVMGIGGLVTPANVGLFQRLYSLMVFVWIGVACYALSRPYALRKDSSRAGWSLDSRSFSA